MRMSHLFGRTLREAPGDVELPSHRLMLRAARAGTELEYTTLDANRKRPAGATGKMPVIE